MGDRGDHVADVAFVPLLVVGLVDRVGVERREVSIERSEQQVNLELPRLQRFEQRSERRRRHGRRSRRVNRIVELHRRRRRRASRVWFDVATERRQDLEPSRFLVEARAENVRVDRFDQDVFEFGDRSNLERLEQRRVREDLEKKKVRALRSSLSCERENRRDRAREREAHSSFGSEREDRELFQLEFLFASQSGVLVASSWSRGRKSSLSGVSYAETEENATTTTVI